ncbi:MAG TPA: hypothetical protein VEF89_32990 [Solirubrobacteraceae bacterium]|nr:hypothetical protein [Solirubrobacteraceae bacterium]
MAVDSGQHDRAAAHDPQARDMVLCMLIWALASIVAPIASGRTAAIAERAVRIDPEPATAVLTTKEMRNAPGNSSLPDVPVDK